MADQPVTIEKLINADKDVQVIEDFIKKPKDETVTTRFGDEIMTLKGLEEEVKKSGGYFKRYTSLAAANADLANIPVDAVVKVTSAVDGGDYEKVSAEATSLTKSAHDPLTQAKGYTDEKVIPLKQSTLNKVDKSASNNNEVAIAVTFKEGHRTWLEATPLGRPTAYSIALLEPYFAKNVASNFKLADRFVSLSTQKLGADSISREYPVFERLSSPLVTYAQQSADTIYWTWMINKELWGGSGLALFYSTDHATHALSGIFLLESDSIDGPWINRGKVYRDDFVGIQTETPSLIYDPDTQKVLMFYQQASAGGLGSQQTLLATADPSDLTKWTRAGIVLQQESENQDGEGHCGYFRPFSYNGMLYGYSLYGGGIVANASLWYSNDGGYNWFRDGSMIGFMQDKCKHLAEKLGVAQNLCVLSMYEGDVIFWRGQLWWVGVVGAAQSGSVTVRNSRLVAAPLSDDLINFKTLRVIDITPSKANYETVEGIDYPGNFFVYDGDVYSAYRTNGQKGAIGLMKLING